MTRSWNQIAAEADGTQWMGLLLVVGIGLLVWAAREVGGGGEILCNPTVWSIKRSRLVATA